MKIINEFTNYILERELDVRYSKGKLDIINYNEILHFSSDKIEVSHAKGTMVIEGKNLVVRKLMLDEILIGGEMTRIEFVVKS